MDQCDGLGIRGVEGRIWNCPKSPLATFKRHCFLPRHRIRGGSARPAGSCARDGRHCPRPAHPSEAPFASLASPFARKVDEAARNLSYSAHQRNSPDLGSAPADSKAMQSTSMPTSRTPHAITSGSVAVIETHCSRRSTELAESGHHDPINARRDEWVARGSGQPASTSAGCGSVAAVLHALARAHSRRRTPFGHFRHARVEVRGSEYP